MEQPAIKRRPNILYYWSVIRQRWMMITVLVVAAVVVAFVHSRTSPKLYESVAVVLPPVPEKLGVSLLTGTEEGRGEGRESSAGLGIGGVLGQGSIIDILKSILHSRTMADAVIEQLNLKAYYGTDSMAAARAALKGETTILVNREKAFFITVLSRDRQMAADIANAYASNLDRLNRMLNVTSATRNRLFIEKRLAEKRQELAKAEEERKQFQIANKTLLITDTAKAAMSAAGAIEANIVELEVELAVLKGYATPSHPMRAQVDAQIQALRQHLDRLEQRQKADIGSSVRTRDSRPSFSKEFYPPALEVPGLALEYVRLSRAVKIHETVLSMLMGQYEQAKIAEAKDTPTIQILDPAIPAESKSRPRTLYNMQVAGAIALLIGFFLSLFMDYLKRLKDEEAQYRSLMQVAPPEQVIPLRESEPALQPDGNGSLSPSRLPETRPDPRTV